MHTTERIGRTSRRIARFGLDNMTFIDKRYAQAGCGTALGALIFHHGGLDALALSFVLIAGIIAPLVGRTLDERAKIQIMRQVNEQFQRVVERVPAEDVESRASLLLTWQERMLHATAAGAAETPRTCAVRRTTGTRGPRSRRRRPTEKPRP